MIAALMRKDIEIKRQDRAVKVVSLRDIYVAPEEQAAFEQALDTTGHWAECQDCGQPKFVVLGYFDECLKCKLASGGKITATFGGSPLHTTTADSATVTPGSRERNKDSNMYMYRKYNPAVETGKEWWDRTIRWKTAYHEAGHAWIATRLGWQVRRVTLDPRVNGKVVGLGLTETYVPNPRTSGRRTHAPHGGQGLRTPCAPALAVGSLDDGRGHERRLGCR